MLNSLALTAPELLLSLGAIALLMVAAFAGERSARLVSWLAVALLGGAALLLLGPAGGGGDAFAGLFQADGFAAFAKLLIFLTSAVAIVAAQGWFVRGGVHKPEYPILILLSTAGAGMMVSATDLMLLYVGLELQSLSSYILASFQRRDERSTEAGLKYFVLGSLASGILLYGISLLYGFTGSTQFTAIFAALGGVDGMGMGELFGLVFVMAGLAFKIAAVPFHMWTPDVYEGAPTPVTALFATAQKVAAVALLCRVSIEALGPATDAWRQIVIFSALASIVLGAVAAYGQTNIKRLLAYSSINNIGFALIGLAAGTAEGIASVLLYMVVYTVMTWGAFLCIMAMRDLDGQPVEAVSDLAGLSRSRPALALAMAMFMLSLAGIPPLFGFIPKLYVFDAAVGAGLWPLALAGAVGSVIGAYYYLKIVKIMYFDDPAPAMERTGGGLNGGLIAAAAVFVSPAGYLALPALGAAALIAARSLF